MVISGDRWVCVFMLQLDKGWLIMIWWPINALLLFYEGDDCKHPVHLQMGKPVCNFLIEQCSLANEQTDQHLECEEGSVSCVIDNLIKARVYLSSLMIVRVCLSSFIKCTEGFLSSLINAIVYLSSLTTVRVYPINIWDYFCHVLSLIIFYQVSSTWDFSV